MWILILVIHTGTVLGDHYSSISVPDFKSAQSCNKAGVEARALVSKMDGQADYVCVEK
jgi:hypothetical protein